MIIESYSFARIANAGQTYSRDVILFPDRVWDGWWRKEGHRLSIADLKEALADGPEVLVVGTGFFGLMQVPTETSLELEQQGIELHVLPTRSAWTLYNELASRGEKVVAALHLSC